jgi:hypothetical protein
VQPIAALNAASSKEGTVMKALKTLVAATALLTTLAATAQTTDTANRPARDDSYGAFVYDALGATPTIRLKAKPTAEAKANAEKDKAAVARRKAEEERAEAARRDELAKY